jgi:hypothetical protein
MHGSIDIKLEAQFSVHGKMKIEGLGFTHINTFVMSISFMWLYT